jgi:hypothetical protein
MFTVRSRDRALLPALDGIILAERVPLELVVAEDAAQIGVVAEPYAEQIVDLALVPVGRVVEPRDRVHFPTLGHREFDPDPVLPGDRAQEVGHLERLFALGEVVAHDVEQKLAGLAASEVLQDSGEMVGRHPDRLVAQVALGAEDGVPELLPQSPHQRFAHALRPPAAPGNLIKTAGSFTSEAGPTLRRPPPGPPFPGAARANS